MHGRKKHQKTWYSFTPTFLRGQGEAYGMLHGVVVSSNANTALCPTYLTFLLIKLVSEEEEKNSLKWLYVFSVYVCVLIRLMNKFICLHETGQEICHFR